MNLTNAISQIVKHLTCLILIFSLSQVTVNAQSFFEVEPFSKPYLYGSASFLKNKDFSKVSLNEYYKPGGSFQNTAKLDIGVQITQNISVELSHTVQSIWMTTSFADDAIIQASSRSQINYFSLSLGNTYNIKLNELKPNKWKVKTQLGYTLGRTTQGKILGSSTGRFTEVRGSETGLTTETITTGLSTGIHHFINLGAGIEYQLSNSISLSAGYFHIQGFEDIIKQDISYDYNNQQGNVDVTSDGSIGGFTIGVKYSFRKRSL